MFSFFPLKLTKQSVQKFIDVKCLNYENDDMEDSEEIDDNDDAERWPKSADDLWEFDDDYFDNSWLDEDKMMQHILDCYAALCAAQQFRVQKKKPTKLNVLQQLAKNKTFKAAISLMSTGMTHDDATETRTVLSDMIMMTDDSYGGDDEEDALIGVFPDDSKKTDGRGWMPLHWATLALGTKEGNFCDLTEEDVKLVH